MNALMKKVIYNQLLQLQKVAMLSTGLFGTPTSPGKLFHTKKITNS